MKRLRTVLLVLIFPALLWAYSPKMIPIGSPVYDAIEILYRLNGRVPNATARPWSEYEAARIIENASASSSTGQLQASALNLLDNGLKKKSEHFSYRFLTRVAVELYGHTNSDTFVTTYDWVYGTDDRKPMLDVGLELLFDDYLYVRSGIEVGFSMSSDDDTPGTFDKGVGALVDPGSGGDQKIAFYFQKPFHTNFLVSDERMFSEWPSHTQLAFGGPWWSVVTGRNRISWGDGKSGTLIVGSHIRDNNHLSISFFSKEAKMQLLYIFLPNPLKEDALRVFLGHRLEGNLTPYLHIAVSENVMYKGPSLQLSYLDPGYFYHNLQNANKLNAIASLELNLAIAKGLSLHTEFAMDQFQLPSESDREANAMAFLGRLAYSWKASKGYFTADLEYVYTDPCIYRRNGVDFLVIRGLFNNARPYVFDYLGYRYGSDSQVIETRLAYRTFKDFSFDFAATFHRQGGVSLFESHSKSGNNADTANIWGPAPSGNEVHETLILTLKGSWDPKFSKVSMSLYAQTSWIGKRLYKQDSKTYSGQDHDLQLVLGTTVSF
ncbi:MAG: capsule assembly Wzi family protein [Spirochaetales bacterium]|nr:hypothetical protein [Spirochaetota bacterium]NLL24707.1 capsule assembly Wzi family protein [Spirochaetales bacterium]